MTARLAKIKINDTPRGKFLRSSYYPGIVYVLKTYKITTKAQFIQGLTTFYANLTKKFFERMFSKLTIEDILKKYGSLDMSKSKTTVVSNIVRKRQKKTPALKAPRKSRNPMNPEDRLRYLEKARQTLQNAPKVPQNSRRIITKVQKERGVIITSRPGISFYRKKFIPEYGEDYEKYLNFSLDNPQAKTGIAFREKMRK